MVSQCPYVPVSQCRGVPVSHCPGVPVFQCPVSQLPGVPVSQYSIHLGGGETHNFWAEHTDTHRGLYRGGTPKKSTRHEQGISKSWTRNEQVVYKLWTRYAQVKTSIRGGCLGLSWQHTNIKEVLPAAYIWFYRQFYSQILQLEDTTYPWTEPKQVYPVFYLTRKLVTKRS